MKIDDVAAALGISKATVSRAITGHGRISPATRELVVNYMEAHDFHPNTIAQSLSKRKTMNIAFTVPTGKEFTQLPFFLQCLVGATGRAADHSYDTLVVNNSYTDVKRVVDQSKIDAVIVSRNVVGSRMLGYLTSTGLPFILIGTTAQKSVLQVDHDHRSACRELTRMLLDQWKGTPGLLAGSNAHLVSRARAQGFKDAAGAAPVVWGAIDEPSVVAGFDQLLQQGVDIVFCEDDMICGYLEKHLRTSDPGVGRSAIRVASFYDSPMLQALNPEVPVLHFDAVELGARACSMVLAALAGETPDNAILDYEIMMHGHSRASTTHRQDTRPTMKGKQ